MYDRQRQGRPGGAQQGGDRGGRDDQSPPEHAAIVAVNPLGYAAFAVRFAGVTRELPRIGAELGGYRLTSALSRGGMAVVYLAEDIRLGRTVALKILAPELGEDDTFRSRFLRESRIASSIDHPNVIPIYDAGEADGLLYIAMRYV